MDYKNKMFETVGWIFQDVQTMTSLATLKRTLFVSILLTDSHMFMGDFKDNTGCTERGE